MDNWDQVTLVDAEGRATNTFVNASSIRVVGATLTASLRQTGRIGGTASLGVSREHHDASNVTGAIASDVTGWQANGNLTYKATPKLDLQGSCATARPARWRRDAIRRSPSRRWRRAGSSTRRPRSA